MNIRTFLIEPSEFVQFAVVRVSHGRKCDLHQTGNCYARWVAFEGNRNDDRIAHLRGTVHGNAALWPGTCDRCGKAFTHEDTISSGENTVYTNADRSWFGLLSEAPPGAMWWAHWMDEYLHHQLEHVLVVKTPGGDWCPDERCSNCTRTDDKEHFCWVLHGPIENVTVDKSGNTCAAGAGSILTGGYHGFLRNGELVRA
jgi:hypothetical protein